MDRKILDQLREQCQADLADVDEEIDDAESYRDGENLKLGDLNTKRSRLITVEKGLNEACKLTPYD